MQSGKLYRSNFANLERTIGSIVQTKDVVGFDVFDTLLRRRIEPEAIKDLVAQYFAELLHKEGRLIDWELIRKKRSDLEIKLGTANEQLGHDHEFLYDDLVDQWVNCLVQDQPEVYTDLIKKHEVTLEKKAQELTPGIENVLRLASNLGKKIYFISDMYFSVDTIWDLLKHQGIDKYFTKGYCSSQFYKKKMTGLLFDLVIKKENINVEKMVFVGDNYYSDVDVPRRKGIDVIHLADRQEKKRRARLQIAEWAANRRAFWKGYYMQELVANLATHIKKEQNENYQLGLLMAPMLILFVKRIMELSKELKIEKLYFLAREGKIFYDIYHKTLKELGLEDQYPAASYLYVSRKSTFLSSMKNLSWEEINRFWVQYRNQSLNQLLTNLSLPVEEYHPLATEAGIFDFDKPIDEPTENTPFMKFLQDPKVQDLFHRHQTEARELFQAYLSQEVLFGLKNVAFIDIGWKGTIQDNIVKAFEDLPDFPFVHGIYMGLLGGYNEWGSKSSKMGFFADYRNYNYIENVIFKNGSVFEMCTTPNHGTTVGYQKENGQVVPVTKSFEVEKENFRNYFSDVFQAIEDYLQDYLKVAPLLQGTADELKLYFIDQIRRYILYPTQKEVKAFLKYSHVESFGVSQVTTYEFKGSLLKEIVKRPLRKAPNRIIDLVRKQIWPEAALKRSRIPFINLLYDLLGTKRSF